MLRGYESVAARPEERARAVGGPAPVWVGLQCVVPVLLGYTPVGMAFGVLAAQAGLSFWETLAMSFFVYAGASQFIAVGLWQAGVSPLTIVFTTFLVNLRHLLMSAAIAPQLSGYSKRWLAYFSSELTDETFALHSAELRRETPGYQGSALLTVNQAAHLVWSLASAAGFLLGATLGDPRRLGLDFALPAMFLALLVLQVRRKLDALVAVVSGLLALTLPQVIPSRWATLTAAILAAALGAVLLKEPTSDAARGGSADA